ncbi:MAG: helix-turn-helix domain-containing protein [Lachnospiraceae bacterium]|nr:helix-turn-helix domain-containing protein [Lachnospiraceae bacterium]
MNKKDSAKERMQSALRLRQIRENAGLTQECFAEIMDISLSAYKKVESGENQISISCLKNLHKKMNVSSDFVLFGENQGLDEAWQTVSNCTETDKLFLMLRLLAYFTKTKKLTFSLKEDQLEEDKEILKLVNRLQGYGEE